MRTASGLQQASRRKIVTLYVAKGIPTYGLHVDSKYVRSLEG